MVYNNPKCWMNRKETWVFNSPFQLNGRYYTPASFGYMVFGDFVNVKFSSSGKGYSRIRFNMEYVESQNKTFYYMSYDDTRISRGFQDIWGLFDEGFRTITLEKPATGEMLEYLQKCANKVEINGVEEGAT